MLMDVYQPMIQVENLQICTFLTAIKLILLQFVKLCLSIVYFFKTVASFLLIKFANGISLVIMNQFIRISQPYIPTYEFAEDEFVFLLR